MQNLLGLYLLVTLLPLSLHAENPDDPKTVRATAGQFAAIVNIVYAKNGSHICSGMLVHLGNVITSASCVAEQQAKDLRIHAGSGELSETMNVSLIIKHPDYKIDEYDYNIAVLRLIKDLTKNTYVHPAVLAKRKPAEKDVCFIAGWSRITDNSTFTMFYSKVSVMKIELCRKCTANTICAGNDYHKGGCIDDLGSPILCNGILHGIFIGSAHQCQTSSGLYSDIVFYMDWIIRLVEWPGYGSWPLPHPATRKMQWTGYAEGIPSSQKSKEGVNYILLIFVIFNFIYSARASVCVC